MKRILVSIISATVLLISSCAVAQPKKSTTRLPEEHLLQLDAQASSLVAEMSRQRIAVWREMRVSGGASALAPSAAAKAGDLKRASLISENRRLLMSEQKVNEAFEAAYRNTTRKLDVNNRLLVVRIAALHWHTQFRRRLQRGLHTSVPGLDSDPRCDGDVVADQLFLNYLRTVWGDSTSSVTEVVETLEPLARQSACLGVEQSEALASAATEAFYDVEAFLRMHQMEWVIPPLASMLTQPFLLFYDVEKYRGINSPFARWFSRYESVLLDMIRQKRSPMLWHGVWLYDRLSGRLLGFSNTARPRNENEVRLDLLLTSLVIPENLGAGSCSLAEMVERGFGHWGYMCAGVACNIDSQASSMAAQIIRGKSPKAADQLSIFDILHTASGLGRISGTLLGMTCGAPGGDAGANGGGRLCNLVGSNDVVTPAAQTIACISRQVVRPGTEVMACLMESTGYCSSPVDHLTKDLQQADMVGVPLGKECTIGNPNADEQSPTRPLSPDTRQELQNAQNKADQAKTQDDLAKDRKDDAQKKDDQASDDLSRAQAAEKSARDALRKASQDPNTKPSDLQAARDKLNQTQQDAADAQTNKNGADADLQAAKDALGRADAALREAREELQKIQDKAREELNSPTQPPLDPMNSASAGQNGGSTAVGRCDPDSPGCDLNKCTAMSESARKTLSCMQKQSASEDSRLPNYLAQGLGCDPTVCDPAESSAGRGPRGGQCLEELEPNAVDAALTKQCGVVTCAAGEAVFLGAGGQCGCGTSGQPGGEASSSLMGNCSEVTDCEWGPAEYKNGACVCRTTSDLPAFSGPNVGELLDIGTPSSFLSINPFPSSGTQSTPIGQGPPNQDPPSGEGPGDGPRP